MYHAEFTNRLDKIMAAKNCTSAMLKFYWLNLIYPNFIFKLFGWPNARRQQSRGGLRSRKAAPRTPGGFWKSQSWRARANSDWGKFEISGWRWQTEKIRTRLSWWVNTTTKHYISKGIKVTLKQIFLTTQNGDSVNGDIINHWLEGLDRKIW